MLSEMQTKNDETRSSLLKHVQLVFLQCIYRSTNSNSPKMSSDIKQVEDEITEQPLTHNDVNGTNPKVEQVVEQAEEQEDYDEEE
jgi:hypothetical protein